MYITYETTRYIYNYGKQEFSRRCQPPKKKVPDVLPKPDFMPTKLVRISDMSVVGGSQIDEGYCALSYSWGQSGEIIHDEATGKYERIDEGKHEIISYDNNLSPDRIIPHKKTIDNEKLGKIYEVLELMDNKNYYFTKTTKYVKFEGIIQHICRHLNIKYIWYDQMCINQDNKEEKHQEITKMHHIYGNAYCTVALVPDFTYDGMLEYKQQYFQRLWTLEEAIKSERLVFVGRNEHIWGEETQEGDYMYYLTRPLSKLNVAQILCHAHQRTSTKDHDRVFALLHLFPDFIEQRNTPLEKLINQFFQLFSTKKSINKINVNYDQPFEDLLIQFYGLLAKKDIRILYFIVNSYYIATTRKYKLLPSWTGVNGEHITIDATTTFQNYDIIGKTMYVTSNFVAIGQPNNDESLAIQKKDLPPPPGDIYDVKQRDYRLCILAQLPGSSKTKRTIILSYNYERIAAREELLETISEKLNILSSFLEMKKENLCWYHNRRDDFQKAALIDLSILTDDVDYPSAEYTILSDVLFNSIQGYEYYPVIKRKQGEEHYIAIGCCEIKSKNGFFADCGLPKQTFSIQ